MRFVFLFWARRSDKWTDGQTDGQAGRQTNRQAYRQTEGIREDRRADRQGQAVWEQVERLLGWTRRSGTYCVFECFLGTGEPLTMQLLPPPPPLLRLLLLLLLLVGDGEGTA